MLSTTAASSRTIYTGVSGALQSFVTTNNTITNGMLSASSNVEHDKTSSITFAAPMLTMRTAIATRPSSELGN